MGAASYIVLKAGYWWLDLVAVNVATCKTLRDLAKVRPFFSPSFHQSLGDSIKFRMFIVQIKSLLIKPAHTSRYAIPVDKSHMF